VLDNVARGHPQALYPLSLVMYFYLDKFSDGRF
jgi:hypothetical protein